MNHLFLIPLINNKDIQIMKYIITLPVSGSKNVKIDGIKVIINDLKINIKSFFFLFLYKTSAKYIISIIFMNSEG